VKVKVSPLTAPAAEAEKGWVGAAIDTAGVGCGYGKCGLTDGQGAVAVDDGVVAEVRAGGYRDDRISSDREVAVAVVLSVKVKVSPLTAPTAEAEKVGLGAP